MASYGTSNKIRIETEKFLKKKLKIFPLATALPIKYGLKRRKEV